MAYGEYAAGEAISSYHPQTRADYLTIGQIVALSLVTMPVAARAVGPNLTPNQPLGCLGRMAGLSGLLTGPNG